MGITSVAAGGNSPEKCNYDLGGSTGEAEVTIKFKDALPNTLYTVWIDRRKRGLLNLLSPDYPDPTANHDLDISFSGPGLARGVALGFATTQGVTSGMGLDANAIITDDDGDGKFKIKLDYKLLVPGASPVVAAGLVNQDEFGLNRVGGGRSRQYREKVNIEDPDDPPNLIPNPSLQEVDPDTGLPVLVCSTAQGITIISHPDFVTYGHTLGVGDTDHSVVPGTSFSGNPPACLPSPSWDSLSKKKLGPGFKSRPFPCTRHT